MENFKKFKISNPQQVLGGKSAIVEDEVVFLQSIVIVDDVVF